jgi:hypothetical protein
MEMEQAVDFGGEQISRQDILSEDLICKIKNLNPDLGGPNDPYYAKCQAFRDELANAELIVINANELNRSSITSLDLSGRDTDVEELPPNYFQTIIGSLLTAFGNEEFSSLQPTHNMYPGFEEFSAFGDTEYSSLSGGKYE